LNTRVALAEVLGLEWVVVGEVVAVAVAVAAVVVVVGGGDDQLEAESEK
jgi:hypothetical protein